jgi:hypothetical protein
MASALELFFAWLRKVQTLSLGSDASSAVIAPRQITSSLPAPPPLPTSEADMASAAELFFAWVHNVTAGTSPGR